MTSDEILAAWDRAFDLGQFPTTRARLENDFIAHGLRMTAVRGVQNGQEASYLVFELLGVDLLGDGAAGVSWIIVVPSDASSPAREASVIAITTSPPGQRVRQAPGHYELDDERALAIEDQRNKDASPVERWARLRECVARIDGVDVTLRPTYEELRRSAVYVTRAQYEANRLIAFGDLVRSAHAMHPERVWSAKPAAHCGFEESFEVLFQDEGLHLLDALFDDRRPSSDAAWQALADYLAGDGERPTAERTPIERVIRKAAGVRRGEVGSALLKKVTTLLASDLSELDSLEGVEALENLETIHLFRTNVSDLSALAGLEKLRECHASQTPIVDITPLGALPALVALHLENTEVSDLSALASVETLERLWLDGSSVRDLTPVSKLFRLHELSLRYTGVTDLGPLRHLMQIGRLGLDGCKVKDLRPLSRMHFLQVLWCSDTSVDDLGPLAGLRWLRYVDLGSSRVSLLPLLACPQLSEVTAESVLDLEGAEDLLRRGVKLNGVQRNSERPVLKAHPFPFDGGTHVCFTTNAGDGRQFLGEDVIVHYASATQKGPSDAPCNSMAAIAVHAVDSERVGVAFFRESTWIAVARPLGRHQAKETWDIESMHPASALFDDPFLATTAMMSSLVEFEATTRVPVSDVIPRFRQALERHPEHAVWAAARAARDLSKRGEYATARELLELALAHHPSSLTLRRELAVIHIWQGNAEAALTALDIFGETPEDGVATFFRAEALLMQSAHEEAQRLYTTLIVADPLTLPGRLERWRLYEGRARSAFASGAVEQARADFAQLASWMPRYEIDLARCLARLGDVAGARQALARAKAVPELKRAADEAFAELTRSAPLQRPPPPARPTTIDEGDTVVHPKFGRGEVEAVSGSGDNAKVTSISRRGPHVRSKHAFSRSSSVSSKPARTFGPCRMSSPNCVPSVMLAGITTGRFATKS